MVGLEFRGRKVGFEIGPKLQNISMYNNSMTDEGVLDYRSLDRGYLTIYERYQRPGIWLSVFTARKQVSYLSLSFARQPCPSILKVIYRDLVKATIEATSLSHVSLVSFRRSHANNISPP